MGIKVEAAAYSSIGGRKNNEDDFYLNGLYLKQEQMDRGGRVTAENERPLQVYAVFDGMGGGNYGEYASSYAAAELKKYQDGNAHVDHADNLRRFLTATSKGIDRISAEHGLKAGACGSTAAILIVGDWWYRTAHVGDSRVYLLRDGELKRLTKDQSEVQRMVDAGTITLEEAWSHPRKNVITHHLGMPLRTGELKSVIGERVPLQVGDCFLVCSDGVSDNLRDNTIQEILDPALSAEENAANIAQQAKRSADKMGIESDNITAIVLKVREVAGSDEAARRVRRLQLGQRIAGLLAALFAMGAAGSLYYLIQMLR